MHSETNPLLQLAFDNTSLSAFKDCPKKYEYGILKGYRGRNTSPALLFGNSYHATVEHFDASIAKGVERELALYLAIKEAFRLSVGGFGDDTKRTRLSLIRSLVYYADQFKNDPIKTHIFQNGKVGLEMSFRFQLPFSAYSGEPFLYAGHIDKLADYSRSLYALERKTTTTTLGDAFFERYTYSSQIGGYVYAGKVVFDTPVSGAIIEGLQVAVNFSRFGRTIVHRVNDHLEEWLKDLEYWIRQVEYSAKWNYWPHNTEACMKYGGCPFRSVCFKSPSVRQLILDTEFRIEKWNPMDNRGTD